MFCGLVVLAEKNPAGKAAGVRGNDKQDIQQQVRGKKQKFINNKLEKLNTCPLRWI